MEPIEQALYGVAPLRGYGFLAASAGFRPEWKAAAEKLCTAYGERPAGVTFPGALFALPLVRGRVAVVEVRDQGTDDLGRPGALVFRVLAVSAAVYRAAGGDPFWLAAQYPPDWSARGTLPSLPLPEAAPPPRTTATLRPILQRDDSAVLLGGAQALLDGSRVCLARTAPEPDLARGLWALLPTTSREDFWPCTFAFRPRPEFHFQVAPPAEALPAKALTEDQAADYPEGRYEAALQHAVQTGDEAELLKLLGRRSRKETLWLALAILVLLLLFVVGPKLLPTPEPEKPPPKQPAAPPGKAGQSAVSEGPTPPDRPTFAAAEIVLPLAGDDAHALAGQLRDLAERRRLALPVGHLTLQLEALDEQLPPTARGDALRREALARFVPRLVGTAAGSRDGRLLGVALGATAGGAGQLRDHGPVERQLRVLLWKHGHADYQIQGPNTLELLERLEARLP